MIKATIKVLGHLYESTGESIIEAITNLNPPKGRGASILALTKGNMTRTKILNPLTTARLFHPSKMRRDIGLKSVISMFNDL